MKKAVLVLNNCNARRLRPGCNARRLIMSAHSFFNVAHSSPQKEALLHVNHIFWPHLMINSSPEECCYLEEEFIRLGVDKHLILALDEICYALQCQQLVHHSMHDSVYHNYMCTTTILNTYNTIHKTVSQS